MFYTTTKFYMKSVLYGELPGPNLWVDKHSYSFRSSVFSTLLKWVLTMKDGAWVENKGVLLTYHFR